MTTGFIKLNRTSETLELLNDPHAFVLLTVIALRARRTEEFNLHNLQPGEALIGDHKKYGLEVPYRHETPQQVGLGHVQADHPGDNRYAL
jgi:hypothetical protein